MFTNLSKLKTDTKPLQRVNWRSVGILLCDLIGAASLFATGYLMLVIAHGFGLN